MAPQRRRHHCYHRLRRLIPVISAISGSLLIFFALLSLLAPSPIDSDRLQHTRRHDPVNAGVDDAIGVSVFRVPRGGGRSDRDIWSSPNAKFFYGCSNASSKFEKAEVVTHPKRYLAIATSGGLNQQRTGAVQLTKFDYRLANKLSTDLQKLRCRVNYHALKFTDSILQMGKELVHRMRLRSKHYIALHLRFEPDMLAFSGCYYGGGEKERAELGSIRKRWKTLHKNNPDKERRHGRCPLTPEEVGLMLRALGYGSDVHIYVASGEVYGGEETLAPLKALFPHFYSKDTIATKEELELFSTFSSRMAALDFIVCDESDVFVTNNNGNMARILAGRRRYFGHKPTIRPNAKKLYRLFLIKENITWEEFTSKVRSFQRGFMGVPNEVRAGRGEFHENPSTCICEDSDARVKKDSGSRKYGKGYDAMPKDVINDEDQNDDDEPEWPDPEDDEEQNNVQYTGLYNGTGLDYEAAAAEDPELEEMLSD